MTWQMAVWALGLAWLVPLPSALLGIIGLFTYHPSAPRYPFAEPGNVQVCFRIVSRGQNRQALRSTVESVRREMAELPLFPYRIETVTDVPVDLGDRLDLVNIVVPKTYATRNGALYKARALHYALHESDLPDEAWIMHLDEETHVTPSAIIGIRTAVMEEEAGCSYRIGQGAIVYHRNLRSHRFLTLADSIRTGDDFGRFYFQHRLGVTLFGLHGSFVLVRNNVEKEVGFDLGPRGSVTEDAWWALLQMQNGRRCRWIDGYVVEQATQSLMDFLKQRRRWFVGLALTALHAPVGARHRAALGFSTLCWSVSWVGVLFTCINLVMGLWIPVWLQIGGDLAYAYYIVLYLVGLKVNLACYGRLPLAPRAALYVLQVVLIPVFSLIEGAGVVYALVRPDFGFHVVRKDPAFVEGMRPLSPESPGVTLLQRDR